MDIEAARAWAMDRTGGTKPATRRISVNHTLLVGYGFKPDIWITALESLVYPDGTSWQPEKFLMRKSKYTKGLWLYQLRPSIVERLVRITYTRGERLYFLVLPDPAVSVGTPEYRRLTRGATYIRQRGKVHLLAPWLSMRQVVDLDFVGAGATLTAIRIAQRTIEQHGPLKSELALQQLCALSTNELVATLAAQGGYPAEDLTLGEKPENYLDRLWSCASLYYRFYKEAKSI